VLGEAASHVSDELQAAHPEVAWREVTGIRLILAHAYFHIDQDIIATWSQTTFLGRATRASASH
jgi:uncharacterized protein with HEPN domain